jgi:hypothetical protein
MHLDRRFLGWGVFLVLVGAIPLAVRAGLLTTTQVESWWRFWPLIIVGIGIGLLLSRTPFEFLGGLLVAATFGVMIGGLLAVGGRGFPATVCDPEGATTPLAGSSGMFTGAASVDLRLDCGVLTVSGGDGQGWTFGGAANEDRPPRIEANGTSLRVASPDGAVGVPFVGRRDAWDVTLPRDIPVSLSVQVNAGSATVAPGAAQLRAVEVQLNAGQATIDLGEVSTIDSIDVQGNAGSASITLPAVSLTGRFQVNAGAVEFCAPPGVALRIRTGDNPVAAYDFDGQGLVRSGTTWESPDFATADVRIDLRAEANAGSITLNPEDGCDG